MKVIFLDFNGVIAPVPHPGGKIKVEHFKPTCIEQLNKITDATGAKIVVTSMWRGSFNVLQLRALLWMAGVEGKILDKTSADFENEREYEICDYVMKHLQRGDQYVILDDMELQNFGGISKHHIQTNPTIGLTPADAREAIRILNG